MPSMKGMKRTLLVAASLLWPLGAHAHDAAGHGAKPKRPAIEEKAFGREGDPRRVTRTIDIDMSDRMRFSPAELRVKQGETIRFRVRNSGKVMHELVLGTLPELKEHAVLMQKHPGMEHDEPHMLHVAPGKRETLVWQFTRPGDFHYGCLVPGHFEAGMIGKVIVTREGEK